LKRAAERLDFLPGANGASRVLAVCEPSENKKEALTKREARLFVHNRQPDTAISIFNSPFGPDVIAVTDKPKGSICIVIADTSSTTNWIPARSEPHNGTIEFDASIAGPL
jgi:hypothetical protein